MTVSQNKVNELQKAVDPFAISGRNPEKVTDTYLLFYHF